MKFAMIGAAGYIAPRHMKAIKDTGNELVAAMDVNDSVGILDKYFPDTLFFNEYERFERHLRRNPIDYFVVCTPNYLHDSHIRFGLSLGAKVICEKPLTVNPWNAESLLGDVNVILQMRLHPVVTEMANHFNTEHNHIVFDYCAPRGNWYDVSWKGDPEKSGGILYNIGIHLFDLCCYLFGGHKGISVSEYDSRNAAGKICFDGATVDWSLSLDGIAARKTCTVNGQSIDLVKGFEDLHTTSYKQILAGRGWTIADALPAIRLAKDIRQRSLTNDTSNGGDRRGCQNRQWHEDMALLSCDGGCGDR